MNGLLLLIGQNPDGKAPDPMMIFLFYGLIILIFYFLMFRPGQKRAAEHRKFVEAMKNGDKVITESGLFGTVVSINDDSVVLKIADNVKVRVLRMKVASSQPAPEAKKKAPAKRK